MQTATARTLKEPKQIVLYREIEDSGKELLQHKESLQVNDSRELLDAVQQEVSLLDGWLVEGIPSIRPVCL